MAELLKKEILCRQNVDRFALDSGAVLKELAIRYPELSFTACRIDNVKPDKAGNSVILYRLNCGSGERLFYAIVDKGNSSLALTPFPSDRSIPQLQKAANAEFMRQELRPLIPNIEKVSIIPLAYAPTMRATMLYEIMTTDQKRKSLIGKTNALRPLKRTYANYQAIYLAAGGRINMPAPLFLSMKAQIAFQEKIEGISLGDLLSSPLLKHLLRQIARQIAHFHRLKVPVATSRDKQKELSALHRAATHIKEHIPELKSRLDALLANISTKIALRHRITGPIHADFHYSNIFVDGKKASLLDFDEMALGDSAVDIGRFLASLRGPFLKRYSGLEKFYPLRQVFLESYLKHGKREAEDIYLFEAANIFTSMASFIRFRHPDWRRECYLMLKEAENLLTSAGEKRNRAEKDVAPLSFPPGSKKEIIMRLKFKDRLNWATNERYMQASLSPRIFEKEGMELTSLKIMERTELERGVKILYQASVHNKGEETEKKNRPVSL